MSKQFLGILAASAATFSMNSTTYAQSAAATGIIAGLGLTAASGKTTLASGAGATEATLLATDAVLAAGAEIRARAAAKDDGRPILVLARGDAVDLTTVRWIRLRIEGLQTEVGKSLHCSIPPPATPPPLPHGHQNLFALAPPASGLPTPSLADISAALATDVSISSVAVSEDDRLLVSAIANPSVVTSAVTIAAQAPWHALGPPIQAAGDFYVLGEISDVPSAEGDLLHKYDDLQSSAALVAARGCTDPAAKAAVADTTAFVQSVASASKGQAPIMLAAELDRLVQPLVLRVAIEQVGGTATVKANIWYELGVKHDPATITTGLLASYRLTNPRTGSVVTSGLVRCVSDPVSFRKVRAALATRTQQACQVAWAPSAASTSEAPS